MAVVMCAWYKCTVHVQYYEKYIINWQLLKDLVTQS
jgi:hypothetical protein